MRAFSIPFFLIACVLLSALSGSFANDLYEPNDSSGEVASLLRRLHHGLAEPIVDARLGPVEDDWFSRDAESSVDPMWVSAWIEMATSTFGDAGTDTTIEMFRGDTLASLAFNDDVRQSWILVSGIAGVSLVSDVSAVIRVAGFDAADSGRYRLFSLVTPGNAGRNESESEPNDTGATANVMSLGDNVSGTLSADTDEDWFEVDMGTVAEEDLLVALRNDSAGGTADFALEVTDSFGAAFTGKNWDGGFGDNDYLVIPAGKHPSQIVRFRVSSNSASGDYRLFFGKGVPAWLECDQTALAIPDNDASGVSDEIEVAGPVSVRDMNARVGVTHTQIADLRIVLSNNQTGTSTVLYDRSCTSSAGIDVMFDDDGTASCSFSTIDGIRPFSDLLSAFDDEAYAGKWTLTVSDHGAGNTGTLDSWCLELRQGVAVTPSPTPSPTPTLSFDCQSPYTSSPAKPIPDGSGAGLGRATDTIPISETGAIQDLNVFVDITHPDPGELSISLVHIENTLRVALYGDISCGTPDNVFAVFDDEGIPQPCPPVSPNNSLIPLQPLSTFDTRSIQGTWMIDVSDSRAGSVGSLNRWCIRATLADTPTPTPTEVLTSTFTPTPSVTPTPSPTDPLSFDCQSPHSSSPSLQIPDGTAQGISKVTDTIFIQETDVIEDLNVLVDISHPSPGEVGVSLFHIETGLRTSLFGNIECTTGGAIFAVFDDEGIAQPCPPISPTDPILPDRPGDTPLSDYDGRITAGTWILEMSDSTPGGTGTLNKWCLLFTLEETPTPTPTDSPGGPTRTNTPTPTDTQPGPSVTPTSTTTQPGPTNTPTLTITPGGPTLTPTPTNAQASPTYTPTSTTTKTPSGPTSTPTPTITPGGPTLTPTCANGPDLDGDSQVGALDLLELLRQLRGSQTAGMGSADLDCNGALDDRDLLLFERSWKP